MGDIGRKVKNVMLCCLAQSVRGNAMYYLCPSYHRRKMPSLFSYPAHISKTEYIGIDENAQS